MPSRVAGMIQSSATIDTYPVPPQKDLSWYLKFSNYSSENVGLTNQQQLQKYLSYMYHCHFMEHHDMNIMGEYFVYPNRDAYFISPPI